MNFLDRKVNMSNVLFYMAYILLIVQSMTRWVNNIAVFQLICTKGIPIILFLCIITRLKKFNYNNLLVMCFLLLCVTLSYLVSKDIVILNLMLFLIASKGIHLDKIVKVDLVIKIIMLFTIFLLYYAGYTQQIIDYTNTRGIRYSFGFGHPNTLGVYIMGICADIAYLNFSRKKKLWYIVMIVAAIFLEINCDSRGSVACIILLLVLSFLMPKLQNNKIIKNIMIYIFPTFMILSFVVAYIFMINSNNEILLQLDELFSSRISLTAAFLKEYSIHLFGSRFINYGTGTIGTTFVLDNAYMSLLIKFGLLVALLFIVYIPKCLKSAFNNKQYPLIICLFVFIIFGLMENGFYVLFYNLYLLALAPIIFKTKVIEVNNENK